MKNVKADCIGDTFAVVSWVNKHHERVSLPVYEDENGWHAVGVFFKHGTSRSDLKFKAMYACPQDYKPEGRVLAALERMP